MTNIELQAALAGERRELDSQAGRVSYYTDGEAIDATPLLLIHTVNAAASAHEVRPLYDHYRQCRPVYAIDLPGYGFSERSDRDYTPRLMTDAIHALTAEIRQRHGNRRIDALAVSLSCEFIARAASEKPEDYQSLALVAPTGFNKRRPYYGPPLTNRGLPGFLKMLKQPWLGQPLFKLLISRPSVRFFLQKTWGSKAIDETMYDYSCATTRQPGARFAPFYFLSGFLFSKDINTLYESLQMPVWMCHGVRGDFTNYCWKEALEDKPNWTMTVFETGALSYFEVLEDFTRSYDEFVAGKLMKE